MKRCFTLSKFGNRINVNTYKRTLYPRFYTPVSVPSSSSVVSSSPSVSKASRLPWYVRFILWIKRNVFKISC